MSPLPVPRPVPVVLLVTPGFLVHWTQEAARLIAHLAGDGREVSFVDAATPLDPDAPPAILVASYPSAELMAFATSGAARTLVIAEAAQDVVAFLQDRSGVSFAEAVRYACASAARLLGVAAHPGVTRLAPMPLDREGLFAAIRAVITGEPVDAVEPSHLPPSHFSPPWSPPVATDIPESAGQQDAIVSGVLGALYGRLRGEPGAGGAVVWSWQLFFSGDTLSPLGSAVVDMTGGARTLLYGPYLHLPAGRWSARVVLAFSADGLDTPLSLGFHAGAALAEVRVQAAAPGIFAADFPVEIADPAAPIELRIATCEGAIEGRIALGMVEFVPLDGVADRGMAAGAEVAGAELAGLAAAGAR